MTDTSQRSAWSTIICPSWRSPAIVFVRLAVGLIFFSQGLLKYIDPNMGVNRFTRIGFPHPYFTAHFVGTFEMLCGLLILIGLFVRVAAIPLVIIICTAIVTTKIPELSRPGQGFWFMVSDARTDFSMLMSLIFLSISGAGLWSMDSKIRLSLNANIQVEPRKPLRMKRKMPPRFTILLLFFLSKNVFAGPPFRTDDPDPVPWHHYEAYLFSVVDRAFGANSWALPAFEFNIGAAPNLQLHLIVPGAYLTPQNNYGLGDVELGAKYRFFQESKKCPEIGIFPLLELPTGDSRLGLGNGQVWARLPVWLQKTHGPWTTYGGGGYQINHAPGMKDSAFAGWLVQRQFTKKLVLGTEFYYQQAQSVGGRGQSGLDMGGYYNFRENLSLLFMAGRSVHGERHTVGYVGLYYTWGSKRSASSGG